MDDPVLTRWLVTVRLVHYAGCLLVCGCWAFDRLVLADFPGGRKLLRIALLLSGLSGAAWFVVVAANMADVPVREVRLTLLHSVWTSTRFGRAWQWHSVFFVIASIAAVRPFGGVGRRIGLATSIGLLAGLAWAGHGDSGSRLHLPADVAHLLVSAIWPAGLVPFCFAVRTLDRQSIQRFSNHSLYAVLLLTLTGLVNSCCLLGSIRALTTTPYGRVLLGKVIVFVLMVGIGARNRFVLMHRKPDNLPATVSLRRNVITEIVLAAAVIGLTSLLGLLEPGRLRP